MSKRFDILSLHCWLKYFRLCVLAAVLLNDIDCFLASSCENGPVSKDWPSFNFSITRVCGEDGLPFLFWVFSGKGTSSLITSSPTMSSCGAS